MTGCAAPRHGEDQADAMPHATVCRPCMHGLARDLRRLPAYHADLDLVPKRASMGARGTSDGLPFDESVSECRSQIRHDLTWWAMEATKALPPDTPPWATDGWSVNPVPAMAGFLAACVKWIIYRPWAPDMAGAIADDASRARFLLDPHVRRHFPIPGHDARCLEQGCHGRLWVTIYADDPNSSPHVDCDQCGARFEGSQWLRLGRLVVQRREAMAS